MEIVDDEEGYGIRTGEITCGRYGTERVVNGIVEQCSGVNNEETESPMYEGDIFKGNPMDDAPLFVVKFGLYLEDGHAHEAGFYGEMIGNPDVKVSCIAWHSGPVIGNIHDNPELLEEAT